jgi:hypothetical protein
MKQILYSFLIATSLVGCAKTEPAPIMKKGSKVFTQQHPDGIAIDSANSDVSLEQRTSKTIRQENGYLISEQTNYTERTIETRDPYLQNIQNNVAGDETGKLKPLDKHVVKEDGTTVTEHVSNYPDPRKPQNPEQVTAASHPAHEEAANLNDLTASVTTEAHGNFLIKHPINLPTLNWPLDGEIIAHFGKHGNKFNDGINIKAALGTEVKAAGNGKVIYVGSGVEGYGNLVIIKHDDDIMTAYSHLQSIRVSRGAAVKMGEIIATVGQTGNVKEPQLHFSVRKGKKTINPEESQ